MIKITLTNTDAPENNTTDLRVDGCILVTYTKQGDGTAVNMYCLGERDMRMERAIAVVSQRVAKGRM